MNVHSGAQLRTANLHNGNDEVNVSHGRIENLVTRRGLDEISVSGTGRIENIEMDQGSKTVSLEGDGRIDYLETYQSILRLTIADDARVGSLKTDQGRLIATMSGDSRIWQQDSYQTDMELTLSNTARINQLQSSEGDVDLTLSNNARIGTLQVFDGDLTATLSNNARISSIQISNGNANLDFNGNSRAYSIKLDEGTHTLSTQSGYLESFYTYAGVMDITIGQGGAGQLQISGAQVASHDVTFKGFVDQFTISERRDNPDDNQSVTLAVNGGAGTIQLGHGKDTVEINDYVRFLNTGGGSDVVRVNASNGSERINLGDGNDTIYVNKFDANVGLLVAGRGGNDTIDFGMYGTSSVVFDLDTGGAYQNPGAPGGDLDAAGTGYILETSVENISGGQGHDTLNGDGGANRLVGRNGRDKLNGDAGADTLNGGGGNDVINGGGGNDQLSGGGGRDVFVFGRNTATDRITDFAANEVLRFTDQNGGQNALTIVTQGSNLRITHDHGVIILEGQGGLTLTSDNFEFV